MKNNNDNKLLIDRLKFTQMDSFKGGGQIGCPWCGSYGMNDVAPYVSTANQETVYKCNICGTTFIRTPNGDDGSFTKPWP